MSMVNDFRLNFQRTAFSKLLVFFTLFLSLLCRGGYGQLGEGEAILQGAILVQPVPQPTQYQTDKIQPGHSVKISVYVENKGTSTSPAGKISVRYAFARPLDTDPKSLIFETEKAELPVIEPGAAVEIPFNQTQQLPSLADFIRNDWSMREYQAIIEVDQGEKIIGTLAITFSAYYYPGIRKEIPVKLPVQ